MSDLSHCLNEILTDETGATITPTCGIEKLLQCLVDSVENMSPGGDITEIDGGYPDNDT